MTSTKYRRKPDESIIPQSKALKLIFFLLFLTLAFFIFFKTTISSDFTVNDINNVINKKKALSSYDKYRIDKQTEETYEKFSLKQKVGQLFMLSISSTTLTDQTTDLIKNYHIGGIVLTGGNVSSQGQLLNLTKSLQAQSKVPLFIAIDQEGGTVARISWDSASNISQYHIGTVNREDFAYETGLSHAKILNDVNININLSPVLDTAFEPSSIMSSRSFGNDLEKVSNMGMHIIKAHKSQKILTAAKHFPGIGRTTTDSHKYLPQIDVSKDQLISEEIVPFKAAIENEVDFIMTGHVLYPQIDSKYPASLSKTITTDILRDELSFNGVIITDDLRMDALDDYENKFTQALEAGNDMLLIVDSYENQIKAINEVVKNAKDGTISEKRIANSVKRILRVKFEKIANR